MNLTKNDRRRLTKKIERQGECLVWTGCMTKLGYGQFAYKRKVYSAHRFVYQLHNGEIPIGLVIDHTCGNRACVNVSHLEAVTQMENVHRGKAMRRTKTHCANGHEWSVENVRMENNGYPKCMLCDRERKYAKYHKLGKNI